MSEEINFNNTRWDTNTLYTTNLQKIDHRKARYYCPKCDKELKDEWVFCPYCGQKLIEWKSPYDYDTFSYP